MVTDMSKKKYGKPCPRCGKIMSYKSKLCHDCTWEVKRETSPKAYCVDCGKRIKLTQKRCWECHKKRIAADDRFCSDCGKKLPRGNGVRCRECHRKHVSQNVKVWRCIDCGVPIKRKRKRCADCNVAFLKTRGSYKRTEEHRQRMSKVLKGRPTPWLKGRKRSPETSRKIQAYWTEEKREERSQKWRRKRNPGYIHGNGRQKYPREFSKALRATIRKRDNYTCQICHIQFPIRSGHLSIHHIDYDKENSNPLNLIALCKSCHGKVHFQREIWQQCLEQLQVQRERNGFPPVSNPPSDGTTLIQSSD